MDVTTQEQTLVEIKQKSGFLEFLLDSLIGTWYGNNDYAYVTWTLTVELWATYFVYIVAQTVVWYRHRYILYIIILLFIYIPRISDDLKLTEYQFRADQNTSRLDLNLRSFLPYFTYGVAIADSENLKGDLPLNALRKLDWWWKIPINLVLVFIFLSYGSMTIPETCKKRDEFDCAYMTIVTGGAFADAFWFFEALAALAGFILALTSSAFQCVLDSAPFWFLGKVSYTLYLGHLLIVKWPAMEMVGYFHTTLGIDYDLAVLYNFLIWTPVALLLAWGLEVLIDTPSKNFAHAVDVISRIEPPKKKKKPVAEGEEAKKEGEDEDDRSCSDFLS
jgi:peptidoglycan/LPS O-acetylase OafA/YrhL